MRCLSEQYHLVAMDVGGRLNMSESEGCKRRSTREILRDMVDVHYSCNTICKRCGYAALVALILSSSVFLMEIAYGAMWTDSRIDYYSGMIGVTFALAAVSVTGYIFLTEHMGHRAVKDSAFDMAADHFKRDSKSAMSVLLTVSFVFAVMLTVTVFLWIGDDYSPRALSIEYVTLPVLCIVFVTLTAAFVQFDYDLITIDTRITKSAKRLEKACRERVNEKIGESEKGKDKGGPDRSSSDEEGQTDDLSRKFYEKRGESEKREDEEGPDCSSSDEEGQTDDPFRKFYEIESIFNSFTDTPKNEQMSIDYRLRYQTQIRDEEPDDNDDIALIDNFFLFREYRDHLLNISRAETYKSTLDKSRTGGDPTHHGSILHQNNIIDDEQRKTLEWCIECLTKQMKGYYKDKKIENVNLKKYSFEEADLRNASINSSRLSECVFSRANCKGLRLSNCEIESLKINNADCEGTESTSDKDPPGFDYAIVSGCHISKPELKRVCMKGSDFEDSLILEITMDEVVATSSRYDDVSFVGGSVNDADFENSNFRNSAIIGMKIGVDYGEDVRLSLCQMSDCTINEVECVGIDATSLEATQIKLTRVTLRKIWMDKTVLESILLRNSSMLNSNMTSCSWGNSKVISSTIGSDEEKPMVIKTSLIRSVEFISVRFTNISMGDVFFENVTFLNCTFDNVDFGNSRFHSCDFEHVYMSKDCNCMDIDTIDCHRAGGWLPKEVEKVLTVSKRIRFS